LLDVEVLSVRVGLEQRIKAQVEWVLEEGVASSPVSMGPDLS
jgi:hypothetical protein